VGIAALTSTEAPISLAVDRAGAPPTAPSTTIARPAPTTTIKRPAPTTTTTAAKKKAKAEVITPLPPEPPTVQTPLRKPVQRFTLAPYRGLGSWLDVYDWTETHAGASDGEVAGMIDSMAAEGVQTLFIQTMRWDAPGDLIEPARLRAIVDRAHRRGMYVVGWYLPKLVHPMTDFHRVRAIASLPVDGLAVDIESTDVRDVNERNRRLVELGARLRAAFPGQVLGGIVLEPVLIEDVNPYYWPSFPWRQIASQYDAWMPMSYWTNRRGEWRDAEHYTAENFKRVRANLGLPNAPLSGLGGIGTGTSNADVEGMVRAARRYGAIGAGLYDFRTTGSNLWSTLRHFRAK
jgi:hypothetical protein